MKNLQTKCSDVQLMYFCQIANLDFWTQNKYPLGTYLTDIPELSRYSDNDFVKFNDRLLLNKFKESDKFSFADLNENVQLLYVATDKTVFKDYCNIYYNETDSGFFALVFKKYDEIITIFRSTDDLNDVWTDLSIGLFYENDMQLVLSYMLHNYIDTTFNTSLSNLMTFTGHSLGGALAEYAKATYTASLGNSRCVTFNGLGIGRDRRINIDSILKRTQLNLPNKITVINEIENYFGISNNPSNILYITEEQAKKEIENILLKHAVRYTKNGVEATLFDKTFGKLRVIFGFKQSKYEKDIERTPVYADNFKSNILTEIIYNSIKSHSRFYAFVKTKIESIDLSNKLEIINYYFKQDITPSINTHLGYVLDVTSKFNKVKLDQPSNFVKTLFDPKIALAKYHGLNNFLLCTNQEGMISKGYVRISFISIIFLYYIIMNEPELDNLNEFSILTLTKKFRYEKKFWDQFLHGELYTNALHQNELTPYKEFDKNIIIGYDINTFFEEKIELRHNYNITK